MERKVTFYSEGVKLAGTLFIPDNLPQAQKRGGIVFCSGFTAARDTFCSPSAAIFARRVT